MNKRVGFPKKTIRKLPLDNQVVLLRADYNVPLNDDGTIADDFRIRMSLPTIRALRERGSRVVIISHLGRPDGKPDARYSLESVAKKLSELLGERVGFVSDCVGDKVTARIRRMRKYDVVLLENLRFYAQEEANDSEFAHRIAHDTRAKYFVQDGFGVVHRAHASTAAITEWLPSVSGLLLEREYRAIRGAIDHPDRPLVAVLGGAKISDKIEMVEAFAQKADRVLIGGAMANTFLAERGVRVGKSKIEPGLEDIIKRIYAVSGADKDKIVLPMDAAVGKSIEPNETRRNTLLGDIQPDDMILDVGSQTIEKYTEIINGAATVIWNGTLGYAERQQFAHGSARIAMSLATNPDIVSVIGGGDTADFALDWDSRGGRSFGHVSTGGGASLELMAGRKLPGIEALLDA